MPQTQLSHEKIASVIVIGYVHGRCSTTIGSTLSSARQFTGTYQRAKSVDLAN
jgi:hypothetical protein